MNIQVSTDSHIQGSAELTSQVEAVLEVALGRYADRITRVEVHLSDENSSEKSGDVDKRCVLEARLAGVPPIVASHHGAAWQQALNGAAEILAKTLKRTLERKNSLFKRRSRMRSDDSFGVDDQQWWVWLLGEDETMSLGDTLSGGESGAAEQVEASELKSRVHALLGAMPIAQRQAFVLHDLEAYELFELAMLQDRPEVEIQADIEGVCKAIRKQLSTRD